MMRLCTPLILMLALYQVDSSDRLTVSGNLNETSSLPCPQPCSGLLTWTMFQRPDDVLVRCTRDSCSSKDEFSLNHDEFLRGDSTLTVLRADYSLRGLYRAECDSETLCQVVFTLSQSKAEQQRDGGASQSHSVRRRSVQSGGKLYTDSNQEGSMPGWASALIAVLVILLILSVFVNIYQWREIQTFRRRGHADRTH